MSRAYVLMSGIEPISVADRRERLCERMADFRADVQAQMEIVEVEVLGMYVPKIFDRLIDRIAERVAQEVAKTLPEIGEHVAQAIVAEVLGRLPFGSAFKR